MRAVAAPARRALLAAPLRAVSFTVDNIFKIKLAETEMDAETQARQDEIDASLYALRQHAKRLQAPNVLVEAVASPPRLCVVHKHLLPSAFMFRFVRAYGEDHVVSLLGIRCR